MKLEGIVRDAQTIGDKTRFRLLTPAKKGGRPYNGWFYISSPLTCLVENGFVRGITEHNSPQPFKLATDRQAKPEPHLPIRQLEIYECEAGRLLHIYRFDRLDIARDTL
ncbi:MAG TPA: hypothetical protein VJG90_00695 [Candidatus Nanoarchaeia archaeon]|nr:hypothetical protein [Candidatus Nanoarchaeia archaeon]